MSEGSGLKANQKFETWTGQLRAFIVERLATWAKKREVFKQVTDPDALEKYGFEPWDGNEGAFYARSYHITEDELDDARKRYLANYDDIPLSNKIERVKLLIELLADVPDTYKIITKNGSLTEVDNTAKFDEKRKLLKEIRTEMGEELWREALKDSGNVWLLDQNIIEALKDEKE